MVDVRHVRAFFAVAEELHFGRAAARLRVAQSAVSQTIKALEASVGAPLFARTKRRVELTVAGRQYAVHAARALEELEAATHAARRAAAGETGRLVLRFSMMSALTAVPRAVARFSREYPAVELVIEPGGSSEQFEALHAGRCDIGFMAIKRDIAPLTVLTVERSRLVATLPATHPLARRRSVTFGDFARERIVFLRRASEPLLYAHIHHHCAEAGFEPNIALEVEQVETLLAFVAAGFGISYTPEYVCRLGFPGVVAIPLRPELFGGICAVWNPTTLSAAGHNFLRLLRDECSPGREGPPLRAVRRHR